MEMEVVIPIHSSNPSSPKGFGEFYCSAPTSPSRISQFYHDFEEFLKINEQISNGELEGSSYSSAASVPFNWEEKPGKPKKSATKDEDDDFAFHVGGHDDWETGSVSAEELFDGGIIKPLKPPPRLQLPSSNSNVLGAFSPRYKRESSKSSSPFDHSSRAERGRERSVPPGMKSSSRRATRSLSPLRVSEYPWEEEQEQSSMNAMQGNYKTESSIIAKPAGGVNFASSALASFSRGYKKWKLKDFFLFRSASEGRAADKDPLKNYTAAIRTSSMRSIDSPSGSVSSRRRSYPVSAHELHYTVNKAVSEDLKKKTFLPYKQGILGRLAFNPAVHALANGFGLSQK